MTPQSAFSDWYQAKLGHHPLPVQGALWVIYGFVWIPVWYLASGSNGAFSAWYQRKLGHHLPVAQITMWVFYGFIWIPAWYFYTRNDPTGAPDAGGSDGGSTEFLKKSPVAPDSGAGPRQPEPLWPAITMADRLVALVAVRPVALEVNGREAATDSAWPIRVLLWNYTRLFALAWAGLSLAVSLRTGPRPGGPATVDLFFMMIGLLYVLYAFLQIFNRSYWRSFVIVSEQPSLPVNRAGLLVRSAVAGLVQVVVVATLVGAVIAIGNAMRR